MYYYGSTEQSHYLDRLFILFKLTAKNKIKIKITIKLIRTNKRQNNIEDLIILTNFF